MLRMGARSSLGLVFGFGLVLSGCAQQAAPAQPSAAPTQATIPGGTVTQRIQGNWGSLDPHIGTAGDTPQIYMGAYDTLVALIDGKAVPYLATKWAQTPTSVKFDIRTDATCSDGTPVTATVVADSFKRSLITDAKTSPTRLRAYGPGPYTITGDDVASTVTVTIGQPFSGLLFAFGLSTSGIICPKGLANTASLATTPSGSGPFTLDTALPGDSVTLTARPDWKWGPNGLSTRSSGFPQKMIYKLVANDTTAANLLVTGGLDVAVINGPDNARAAAESSLIHKAASGYWSTAVLFNQSAGRPTADQNVRQALATTINRADFGKAAYYSSTPNTSFIPPQAQCFDASTASLLPTPDVAKAKQIMTTAGYTLGTDGKFRDASGKLLTINILGGQNQGQGPDYLLAQFTAAGFDAKLNKPDITTFATAYLAGNFDVTPSQGASDVPDPNAAGLIGLYTGTPAPAGGNYSFKDYPTIDAEIAAANGSTGEESCKHWAAVQQELLKRFVILPTVTVQYDYYGRGIDFLAMSRFINPMFLKRVR